MSTAIRLVGVAGVLSVLAAPASAQSVVDILPATNGAWGLDVRDGFLWVGDDIDGFIRRVDPADGSVLEVIGTPYDENTIAFGANHGVAWADSTIWVAGDFGKDWLYEIDATGATLDSLPTPTDAVGGLGWDGSLLLVTTYFPNDTAGILRIDPADGSQVGATLGVSGEQPFGVAYRDVDGTVWNGMDDLDGDAESITQYEYPSGAFLSQFLSPAESPKGIAFGDGFMWLIANNQTGAGRRIYKIDIGGAGTPDIALEPTEFDYGIVAFGSSSTYEQWIINEGDGDLEVAALAVLAPFSVETISLPAIVSPGDTLRVDVTFTPGTLGAVTEDLVIASNDIDEPSLTVTLTGTGVPMDPLAVFTPPTGLAFEDTGIGLVRDQFLTVDNFGFDDLVITSVSIDDPEFLLVPDQPLPAVLSTFDQLSVQVIFAPTDGTPHTASLTVESNDASSPATIDVSGTGVVKTYVGGDIIWSSSGIENVVNTLVVPDINGDGIDDAIMETYDAGADPGDPHRAYYGNSDENGVLLWSLGEGMSGGYGEQGLALHPDADGDSAPEIVRGVAWGGRRVELRESVDGNLLWSYDTTPFDGGGWIYSVDILPDVTGDGVAEVVAGAGTDSGSGTGARRVVCLDGAVGMPVWTFIGADAFLSVAAGEDVNDDTVPDVVAGAGGNGADTRVWMIDGASTGSATTLWEFDTGGSVWTVAFIDDVNGDDVNDVVAGSWSNTAYCLSGVDGALLWSTPLGGGALRVEVVDDVNADGVPDVGVANLSAVFRMLSGADGATIWNLPTSAATWSTSAIEDVTGDGINDILVGSQNDDAYCVDGVTGDVRWQVTLGPLVHVVRPIPDVNGSGFADVLAGTQRLSSEGGDLFCIEGNAVIVDVNESPAASRGVQFVGLSANPMPGRGAFVFDVGDTDQSSIEVSIFDASGRHIRSLVQRLSSGTSHVAWDGLDTTGRRVTSGNYFYRIRGLVRDGSPVAPLTGKLTIIH